MRVKTMMRIVQAFGLAALFATLVTVWLALSGSTSAAAAAPDEVAAAATEAVRVHVIWALTAGFLVVSSHSFFVFFLSFARKPLQVHAPSASGWASSSVWAPSVVLALAAIGLTLAAVMAGITQLTEEGAGEVHRWIAWSALSAQILALLAEHRSVGSVSSAEAADLAEHSS